MKMYGVERHAMRLRLRTTEPLEDAQRSLPYVPWERAPCENRRDVAKSALPTRRRVATRVVVVMIVIVAVGVSVTVFVCMAVSVLVAVTMPVAVVRLPRLPTPARRRKRRPVEEHRDTRRSKRSAENLFANELVAVEMERSETGSERLELEPGVNQRAEKHVAADPREGIKVKELRHRI